jgi:energy-coupling factor transporter ATP-binding protein EcfA2
MSNLHAGIREITIKDFRGIDELKLSFVGLHDDPTQIVVLGGPNGSGKTAVLEACLLAGGQERLIRGKAGPQAIRAGTKDYHIEAVFQVQNHTEKVICESRRSGRELVPIVYFSSWRAPTLPGPVGITVGKKGKRPAKTEENRLKNIKQYFANAGAQVNFPNAPATLVEGFQAAMSDLNRAWQMFYPEQSIIIQALAELGEGLDLYLVGRPDAPALSVDLLSSGQLELLTFIGGLVTDKTPQGIMVIDEPELHLDPQWHRQLLNALQFLKPDWQIIAATHSPEIYDSVLSFERHFLLPDDDPRVKSWNAALVAGEDEQCGEDIRSAERVH